jgi:putative spermidine/putrescine transport system ATP-binding protein
MSDRLAVFNDGKIEQSGTPAAVYETPANVFVAGFVGVSNVLEREGRSFTIRPEKIRLLGDRETVEGLHVEAGTVRDTSYTGSTTRFEIDLEHGGALMVTQQNLETSHDEARDLRGRQVRVGWRERQTVAIAGKNPEEGSD